MAKKISPRAYATIAAGAGSTFSITSLVASGTLNLNWGVGDTVVFGVFVNDPATPVPAISVPGFSGTVTFLYSTPGITYPSSGSAYVHLFVIFNSPAAFSGTVTVSRTGSGTLRVAAQVYTNVGRVINQDTVGLGSFSSSTVTNATATGPTVTTSVANTWIVTVFGNSLSFTWSGARRLAAGNDGAAQRYAAMYDAIAATPGANTANGTYTTGGAGTPVARVALGLEPLNLANPDFSLSVDNSNPTVVQGSSTTVNLTINPLNGFSSSVTYTISGLPSGVTASFTPNPASSTCALQLTASSSAATGAAVLTVTGTSGSLVHTIPVNLTVNALPDFSLSVAPASLTLVQGNSGPATITIAQLNGFSGNVQFTIAGLPPGVTAAFAPNPGTTSSAMTLTASSSATVGPASLTITGTSGSLVHTVPFSLTVNSSGPPPTGTNDLSTRQWSLGLPTPYASPNSILWFGEIFIRQLTFSNYVNPGDLCVVKDAHGRVVWEGTGSADKDPIRSGKIGWVDGFCLDQLGSGVCMCYIK